MATALKRSEKGEFPRTLMGFGYTFTQDGFLRKFNFDIEDVEDIPFEFKVKDDDPDYNQRHYEAIGTAVSDYIYELMETDLRLHRLDVPLGEEYFKKTFIYVTKDVLINPDRLLILIHGSGCVRAGQWSRSLIINEGLNVGSQVPYINKARALGYAVMVLNTNDNKRVIDGKSVPIKNSGDPFEHFKYVWKTYIEDAKARHIAIVAHSYGGVVVANMANFSDFMKRVYAIALTDSVHSLAGQKVSTKVATFLRKVSCNWVADASELDTPVCTTPNEISAVSAGHTKHEMTSCTAMESVFKFLEERYKVLPGVHYTSA